MRAPTWGSCITKKSVEEEGRRALLIAGDVQDSAFCAEAVPRTHAALPHLKPGSAIVNTGSITGLEGSKQLLDYSATKGAIHAFTKALAQNLVGRRNNGGLAASW